MPSPVPHSANNANQSESVLPRRRRRTLPADVMSITECSRRLGISASTGYRLAEAGKLPGAFQIGQSWRVSVPRFERVIHGDEPTSK